MPLYDYKCECSLTEEVDHKMTERPEVICACGKRMVKQIGAPIAIWKTDCPTSSGGKECKNDRRHV
jgi:putative FmdB family regulatory protein